jgi:hypothetical protein
MPAAPVVVCILVGLAAALRVVDVRPSRFAISAQISWTQCTTSLTASVSTRAFLQSRPPNCFAGTGIRSRLTRAAYRPERNAGSGASGN